MNLMVFLQQIIPITNQLCVRKYTLRINVFSYFNDVLYVVFFCYIPYFDLDVFFYRINTNVEI